MPDGYWRLVILRGAHSIIFSYVGSVVVSSKPQIQLVQGGGICTLGNDPPLGLATSRPEPYPRPKSRSTSGYRPLSQAASVGLTPRGHALDVDEQ